MGFKLPGKSVHSGTSSHKSALKMKAEQKAASALKQTEERETSWFKGEEGWIPDEWQGGDKATVITSDGDKRVIRKENREEHLSNIAKEKRKAKIAKGGTRTWEEGSKASGGTLNDLVKQRKGLKKGSDEYNAVQNKINKALGSEKRHGETKTTKGRKTTEVTPGISEKTTKTRKSGTVKKTKEKKEGVLTKSTITGQTGLTDKTIKKKYDKEGKIKRSKVKYKTDTDKDKSTIEGRGRARTKYGDDKKVVKSKQVHREGGRRYVKKTKDGKTTTRSRRTLKGILTGKGKEDKSIKTEKSPAKIYDKSGKRRKNYKY